MSNKKVIIWYSFVVISCILLVLSFLYRNFYLTGISFIIALVLNKYNNNIPIPKQFKSVKDPDKKITK